MQYEHRYMLELSRFRAPDGEKLAALMDRSLHYPYILGQLLMHRMGAAAYVSLERCGLLGRVNREFRNALQCLYEAGVAKTESLLRATEELEGLLGDADFPYALLKGALLARLYPKGVRTSNDIDLLLRPGDITPAAQRLKRAGFTRGYVRGGVFVPATRAEILSSRMNRGETVPFVRRMGLPGMEYLELDLNFSLDYQAGGGDAVGEMLSRRETMPGCGLYTLSLPDFILHLCAHLYKEATVMAWVEMGRDQSLYKYADLYLLTELFLDEELAGELGRRAEAYGLQKECAYALRHTRTLFSIRSGVLDRLIDTVSPADETFMRRILDPQSRRQYGYDMDLIDWIFCADRKEHIYAVEAGGEGL